MRSVSFFSLSGWSDPRIRNHRQPVETVGRVQWLPAPVVTSINNNDQYVGVSTADGTHLRATLWTHGVASGLAPRPDSRASIARGINDSRQIVGDSGDHAVLWESGSARPIALGDLPGTSTSVANAINASGQIVGTSGSHAVLWEKRMGDSAILAGELERELAADRRASRSRRYGSTA